MSKYQQITIDGKKMVRQMPIEPETDEDYQIALHEAKYEVGPSWITPTYPSELNLPDGSIVEEGKDFEWLNEIKRFGDKLGDFNIINTAIPLQSKPIEPIMSQYSAQQDNEDEHQNRKNEMD